MSRRKSKASVKKSKYQLKKEQNWDKWKASQLRSDWLRRCKSVKGDITQVPMPKEIEAWLKKKQPFKCMYSGVSLTRITVRMDHMDPVSKGGPFSLDNIATCSARMNGAKGNLTDKEFKKFLKFLYKELPESVEGIITRLSASGSRFGNPRRRR